MSTYHAIVWIDHSEAHVVFFNKPMRSPIGSPREATTNIKARAWT